MADEKPTTLETTSDETPDNPQEANTTNPDDSDNLNNSNNQENEEMEVVTMVDVLNEERELEEDANAVLGGSDEKNCTYSKGYLKRQALYACVTCIPASKTDASKRAGVCLACSYSCHENHELIELYTKRHFRCDCGNSKFEGKKCNLEPEKCDLNEDNLYNNNFSGLYCNCERPYPDPEDNTNDDMIQCIVCEDWYHTRHLGGYVPPLNSYSEMICGNCLTKHDFILNYSSLAVQPQKAESEKVDVTNEEETECKMPKTKTEANGALFWPDNWRQSLCNCNNCTTMYETQKVEYLIDLQDTVHVYEEKGKAKGLESSESQYEQGLKALSSLDRVKQVEVVSEYNAMKDQLKEYLQKFADNKKVVREEDIREFFSNMAARKKQKVDMPYFCR